MIEIAIRSILLANQSIVELIGDRIRPSKGAQDDASDEAYITYKIASSERLRCLNSAPVDIRETIELYIHAPTDEILQLVTGLVIDELDEAEGVVGDFVIDTIFLDDQTDMSDTDVVGDEKPIFQMDLAFRSLFHRNS